ISQEDSLNIKRNWAGVISCFLLFTVVWLSPAFKFKGGLTGGGHPQQGVVFFNLPGAAANFILPKTQIVKPPIWANTFYYKKKHPTTKTCRSGFSA
ncbi:inner membrane protein YbjM, partial [Enterobacter asburiae]